MANNDRWVTAPRIYPLSRPEYDHPGLTAFLRDEGIAGFTTDADTDADALPELAGRICYMSFATPRPGGNAAYLGNILSQGHGSVLEHSNLGFILTGVSRSLTHELVRHRAGFAYSQLSQRYVDSSDVRFVVPPAILALGPCRERTIFEEHCTQSLSRYDGLRNHLLLDFAHLPKTDARKKASEAARSVLPNATETKIVVTANLRAWRHLIELRSSPGADAEIRRLAMTLYHYIREEAPQSFQDFNPIFPLGGGSPSLTPASHKV